MVDFNRAQQELVTREVDVEEDGDYLKAFNVVHSLLDRIQNIKNDLLIKSKQSIAQMYKKSDVNYGSLKSLLLKETEVKSLQRICIDFFNKHGPDLLDTYLKCDSPIISDDEEEKKSDKETIVDKNCKILNNNHSKKRNKKKFGYRSFGSRKRKRSDFSKSFISKTSSSSSVEKPKKVTQPSPVKESPTSETHENESNPSEERPATRRRSRALSRVNYVDDIPDSVLFYDEIQEAKRRKLEEKVILESIKEASKRQQSSPNPQLVPPLIIRVNKAKHELFHTNPESEIKINSAISVTSYLIPEKNEKFFENDLVAPEIVNIKCECQFCGVSCDNLKLLAIHNRKHFQIRLRRVGEKLSLHASLRRGIMLMEKGRRTVRCSNCGKTFTTADQIKEHWNKRNCEYYCTICYEDFYRSPEDLRHHWRSVHGIRREEDRKFPVEVKTESRPLDLLENMTFDRLTRNVKCDSTGETSSEGNSGNGFKLKVKSVSMINASAVPNEPPPPPPLSHVSDCPPLHFPYLQTSFKVTPPPQPPPVLSFHSQLPNQRAVCHICHCSFPNTNSRNSHMKIHKQIPGTSSWKLPAMTPRMPINPNPMNDFTVKVNFAVRPCGFRYFNRAEFIQHRSECKDCRYACTVCVKTFQSGSELQMHIMLEHPRSLTFKR